MILYGFSKKVCITKMQTLILSISQFFNLRSILSDMLADQQY